MRLQGRGWRAASRNIIEQEQTCSCSGLGGGQSGLRCGTLRRLGKRRRARTARGSACTICGRRSIVGRVLRLVLIGPARFGGHLASPVRRLDRVSRRQDGGRREHHRPAGDANVQSAFPGRHVYGHLIHWRTDAVWGCIVHACKLGCDSDEYGTGEFEP